MCIKTLSGKIRTREKSSVMKSGILSEEDYIGRYMVDFNFSNSLFLDKKVAALSKRCGFPDTVDSGINWAYVTGEWDPMLVICTIILLLVIFISGYLIIYNVFYMNVYADIRYYGLLKTIGTTETQLCHIVRRQAYSLSCIGIPIGMLGGILIGKIVLPYIVNLINFSGMTSSKIHLNAWVFASSALFSFITVYISCIKPCKIASRITPVEAVKAIEGNEIRQNRYYIKKAESINCFRLAIRNVKRNKKKLLVVVMSLSLALILLNSIYTFVRGYDINKFLSSETISDYSVSDATLDDPTVNVDSRIRDGVTPEFLQEAYEQNGVKEICNIYSSEFGYEIHFTEEDWEKLNDRVFGLESVQKTLQSSVDMDDFDEYMKFFNEDRGIDGTIYGIGELACQKLENIEGMVDWNTFKKGDYIIVNRYTSRTMEQDAEYFYPGEEVTLFNPEGESKKYKVMAIADMPYAVGSRMFSDFNCHIILPEKEFLSFYGQKNPMRTLINVDVDNGESFEQWIEQYCSEENPNLDYTSKRKLIKEFETDRQMYMLVGGILVFILALIGILNLINTITTSIMSRKQELSMMEAIGMTGKQQKAMMIYEGLVYSVLTAIVTVIISIILSIFLLKDIVNSFFAFSYHFSILPVVICIPVMIFISAIVPVCCYKVISGTTLVERMCKNE